MISCSILSVSSCFCSTLSTSSEAKSESSSFSFCSEDTSSFSSKDLSNSSSFCTSFSELSLDLFSSSKRVSFFICSDFSGATFIFSIAKIGVKEFIIRLPVMSAMYTEKRLSLDILKKHPPTNLNFPQTLLYPNLFLINKQF